MTTSCSPVDLIRTSHSTPPTSWKKGPCFEKHGYAAQTPGIRRFAGIRDIFYPSAAKRYSLATGRVVVLFRAWLSSRSGEWVSTKLIKKLNLVVVFVHIALDGDEAAPLDVYPRTMSRTKSPSSHRHGPVDVLPVDDEPSNCFAHHPSAQDTDSGGCDEKLCPPPEAVPWPCECLRTDLFQHLPGLTGLDVECLGDIGECRRVRHFLPLAPNSNDSPRLLGRQAL